MPISYEKEIIFVHIPKCAGTSITKSLRLADQGHHHASRYQIVYPEQWETYYKFAIVRNPWDRLVSCYEYARMDESYYHSVSGPSIWGKHVDYDLLKDATFEECLELLQQGKLKHQGWAPQSDWVSNNKGELLIDTFIKVEEMPEKIAGVKIEKLNTSNRSYQNYEDYYTDETIDLVSKIYSKDIELFDYEFGS